MINTTRGTFPVITGAASACPPSRTQEELWDGFFAAHFGQSRWARRVFMATGVRRRHSVVDLTQEDVSGWTTGRRMERYVEESVPLATDAVARALAAADRRAADIGLLAVVSCTGYATPGVDQLVAAKLGFAPTLQRLVIGHMGCYGAVPGLGAVADFVTARRQPAVLACVELPSLHVQPPTADMEQVVAHALFSDAASAVVLEPPADGPPGGQIGGLALVDVAACTDADAASLMTWSVTDHGFRMTLDRHVPDVLAVHVGPAVDDLLARNQLGRGDVAAWAVHPGGPRILDVVADRLGLAEDDLAASRHVLAEHGNCSSATLLLVLAELRRRALPPGAPVVAMAFGPGLTLYACLLRCT
ncbi:MAG TPA: 3-oxoacyl-[acyl-carrier-protein] synthase III C-terminal domain-containing protein [Streptosporangiaceae bacterium]